MKIRSFGVPKGDLIRDSSKYAGESEAASVFMDQEKKTTKINLK